METIIPQQGGGPGDLVKDTTTQGFTQDVIEASKDAIVLVDFWAPWCGPCKQLTPVLEKIVQGAKGAVRLVKMNIDEHPSIAGQLGVQSIPAVFAFKDGRPVDGFMGALPESQVKDFIKRVSGPGGSPEEVSLEGARAALEAGDVNGAAAQFAAALQADAGNAGAIAGLAKCYTEAGDLERARQTLDLTPPDKANDAEIVSARASINLKEQAAALGDAAGLQDKVTADENDHDARFALALALNADGQRDEAADHLVEIVKRDREWGDDKARAQLLQLFEAWGPQDPATVTGRRKLSTILFS